MKWSLRAVVATFLLAPPAFSAIPHEIPTREALLSPAPEIVKDEHNRITKVTSGSGETTTYEYFEGDEAIIRAVTFPDGQREEFELESARESARFAYNALLPFSKGVTFQQLSTPCSGHRVGFTGYFYRCGLGDYLTPSGRFYDPEVGRFSQQDAFLGDINRPPSLNRYLYGSANPTRFIDPTGHSDEDANELAKAMSGTLAAQTMASEHKPAWQRSWWENWRRSFATELVVNAAPGQANMMEGLARQDARQVGVGAVEAGVAAVIPSAVKRGAAKLVEKAPVFGRGVGELAEEALERGKAAVDRVAQAFRPAKPVTITPDARVSVDVALQPQGGTRPFVVAEGRVGGVAEAQILRESPGSISPLAETALIAERATLQAKIDAAFKVAAEEAAVRQGPLRGRDVFRQVRTELAESPLEPAEKVGMFERTAGRITEADPSWQATKGPAENAAGIFIGEQRPFGLAIDKQGRVWTTLDVFESGTKYGKDGAAIIDYSKWRLEGTRGQ